MPIVIKENIPLAPLTTMKVGGPARYFVEVKSEDEAREALQFARGKDLPVFVLGGGSNIVVNDEGFPGLVIKNEINGFEIEHRGDKAWVTVGAGEGWDEFVKRAVEMDLAGVENLSGVPGTAGSAPVQNVGCYGQSVEETIAEVRAVDVSTGETRTFSREDCKFRYRDSIFRSEEAGKYLITRVVFELTPGGKANLSAYPDIKKYFEGRDKAPTLTEMRRAIIEIRSRKGMVIMPEYESFQSVGSFFKNPVVTREEFEGIKTDCPGTWFWEQNDGRVKISAACLVEQSGFPKGYREGQVGISPKQPLAIINLGGANARDVVVFSEKIRKAVRDKFGIELEPEAQFVGFSN